MILKTYNKFLNEFFNELKKTKINLPDLTLDHIGYQASSSEDYENIQKELNDVGKSIHEAVVGDRRVGIYKLNKSIVYDEYKINIIEVVEPRKDQEVDSHWEHVEMTVSTSVENFMKKYPDLEWDVSALNRDIFPMLILHLENGMRIKFPRKGVLEELRGQSSLYKSEEAKKYAKPMYKNAINNFKATK